MIEIVAARKDKLADENAVREALAKLRPDRTIENIVDKGDDGWLIRLADLPPFLQDKDKSVDPDGDGDDDSSPATDTDDDAGSDKSDKSDKSDSKGDKPKGDVASELKDLIGQLQDVLKQVTDKATDAVSEVEDHRDKLDKAKDALGDEGGDGPLPPGLDDGPLPPDVGPTPGKAPAGPPMPPKRPGVPSGGAPRPGVPNAFSKRRTEIVRHAGVDEKTGNSLTLLEAANALESDPEWGEYKIVGMTENSDGSFSAKLRLR
jgi:hypothetical protein